MMHEVEPPPIQYQVSTKLQPKRAKRQSKVGMIAAALGSLIGLPAVGYVATRSVAPAAVSIAASGGMPAFAASVKLTGASTQNKATYALCGVDVANLSRKPIKSLAFTVEVRDGNRECQSLRQTSIAMCQAALTLAEPAASQ